ncbi:hypothetical protein ACSV9I_05385 [Rhizobium sp. G187]|uniref:hypothetical protein n=1 Tax=Rhizobium sp. G187 TaxID=3451352 RepID=UPI003EE58CE6
MPNTLQVDIFLFTKHKLRVFTYICATLGIYLAFHSLISSNFPGVEWDESVYACITENLNKEFELKHVADISREGQFYGWHPPFYFYLSGLLSHAFDNPDFLLLNRSLNNFCMGLAMAVFAAGLYRFGKLSLATVTVGMLFACLDLWNLISGRIGWFENVQFVIVALTQLALIATLLSGTYKAAALAGFLAGWVVIFKHIGAWEMIQIGLLFLLFASRRKQFLVTGLVTAVVIFLYGLLQLYRGGDDYINQQLHHTMRAVGKTKSPSVNFDLMQAINIFIDAYGVFWPSIAAALLGLAVAGCIYLRAGFVVYRCKAEHVFLSSRRDVAQLVLATWLLGAFISLLAIKLRNPHYYFLIFIPASFLVGVFLANLLHVRRWRRFAAVLIAIFMIGNVTSLTLRLNWDDSVLTNFYRIYHDRLAGRMVFTEEPLACLAGDIAGFRDVRLSQNRDLKLLNGKDIGAVVMLSSRSYQPPVSAAWRERLAQKYRKIYEDKDWKWNMEIWMPAQAVVPFRR